MKRISLLTILCFLVLGSQVQAGDLIALGLKGGIANNWMASDYGNIDNNKSPYLGWQAGAYTRINLPIIMGIKGEILYTKKGYDTEFQGVTTEVRTDHIDIPILLSFGIAGKLELDIGPQFSYRISDDLSSNAGQSVNFGDAFQDLGEAEFGLALGADVNIIKRLGAYLRYTYGFNNSFKDILDTGEYKVRNSTLQIGVKLRLMN